jgi:hypothetical protein
MTGFCRHMNKFLHSANVLEDYWEAEPVRVHIGLPA